MNRILTIALALLLGAWTHGNSRNALFGINVSGAEYSAPNWPTSGDWSYLAGKGISFARLPIAWENIQTTLGGALNATYLANLKTAIAGAQANGIGVNVDLHNYSNYVDATHWGSGCSAGSGCITVGGDAGTLATGVSYLGNGVTAANFANVWSQIATALVGTPGLSGYDLMNEPFYSVGTNLIPSPNGFGNPIGSQPWINYQGANPTVLASGTNPLGATYGPAWTISGGTGNGEVYQPLTYGSGAYVLSCYAKTTSGTVTGFLELGAPLTNFTATTSWQRFNVTATPGAGASYLGVGVIAAAATIQVANCQLETGTTPTTYIPNPYLAYAQAAITAIRAVDAVTPIKINGFNLGNACEWPWINWELGTQLTGGNLIFEAHQYFDGTVAQCGGGGAYAGTYTSYSSTSTAGVQEIAPYLSWCQTVAVSCYLGELNVPNNATDNNAAWLPLQANVFANLRTNGIPATLWYYGSNGWNSGDTLNVAPLVGVDDPRLTQMLAH
jgi:hypothetical protein